MTRNLDANYTKSSTLLSASDLSGEVDPFQGVDIVKEINFIGLLKHCKASAPYFLIDIPKFLPDEPKTSNHEDCVAIAIAKLLHHDFKPVWNENKLVGVMCEGGIVLSNRQRFAIEKLPAWLCSTKLFPDISVYPFDGKTTNQSSDASTIKQVQHLSLFQNIIQSI